MARLFSLASSQYLQIDSAVITSYPFSVSAWFMLETSVNSGVFWVGDKDVDTYYTSLQVRSTGQVRAWSHNYGGSFFSANSTATADVGVWTHIGGKWASVSDRKVYVSGVEDGSDTGTVGAMVNHDRTAIGREADNSPRYYTDGAIAEMGVWDAELIDAEWASLGAGFSPLLVRPQSLVAYWQLFGNASPEPDRVGGYDMTLVNAPTKAPHPRIIYPDTQIVMPPPSAIDVAASINIAPSGNYVQVV